MKFDKNDIIEKNIFGIKISEYCMQDAELPIDCAIANFRNSEYPQKINHNFDEMLFTLKGECEIIINNQNIVLNKYDVFIIPVETSHIIRAEYADVLIACSPQFKTKNVEFVEKNHD